MNNLASKKGTFIAVVVITLLVAYVAFFGANIGNTHLKGASEMRFGVDIKGGIDATFVPKDLDRDPTAEELEAAQAIIETRLDQQNVVDRDVIIDKETNSIFVRYPWRSDETDFDPGKAIEELGSTALLTFKDPEGNVVLEGKNVSNAVAERGESGYVVKLTLKPEGKESFSEATGRLINQEISINLDDEVISSPKVESQINDDTALITGMENFQRAKELADKINAGALPFALHTENYSTISPELGSDALNIMVMAGLVAFLVICLLLIFYYRLSGVIAAISLLLQMAGQIILLTWPQFSITLPGIAGIILSIGMGVDANVIVSERIREELKAGKTTIAAITSGFKMAFSSIFDGNITVLIVAAVMMKFGSGAILSFAFTLVFGIIMNFVAGVLATRLMTVSIAQNAWAKKTGLFLSKRNLEKKDVKVISFFKHRKIYYTISALIIALGIVMTFVNGINLDIQFKGGTILKYAMSETVDLSTKDVEEFASATLEDRLITAQITTAFDGEKQLVLNMAANDSENVSNEDLDKLNNALKEKFPEQEFNLESTNNVSPFFGEKFRNNAIIAILLSIVLIVLYVWFSFRKMHGLSAGFMSLVALFHDVLVAFFAFIIFQIPIGDSFVAVALAIFGYSINDTIVIYDRIRENVKISRSMPIEDIVDKSISQSFTRSLNTNFAVFISLAILYVFAAINGLDSIISFALPMAIGSISGCYSTICLVGPLWASWERRKERRVVSAKK